MKKFDFSKIWTNPVYFIAFGFGSGLSPVMPGTVGTLAAIPIVLLIQDLPFLVYVLITSLLLGLGIWACDKAEKDMGVKDFGGMNFDEFIGYLFTMFAAPHGWIWLAIGFALFRLFDIWKPWPIRWFDQRSSGGFWMIIDDVIAAIPAWVILQLIAKLFAKSLIW